MSLTLMKSIGGALIDSDTVLYARGFTTTGNGTTSVKEFAIEIVFEQPNTMLSLYYKDEATRDKDLERLQS